MIGRLQVLQELRFRITERAVVQHDKLIIVRRPTLQGVAEHRDLAGIGDCRQRDRKQCG